MRVRRLLPLVPLALVPTERTWGQTPPSITTMGGVVLGLETVTSTGGPPLALEVAPGDSSNRLFIAGQTTGRVELLKSGTVVQTTPYFSTASGGLTLSSGSEKGLIGIAFHPNYNGAPGTPGAGKFYTFTSEPKAPIADVTFSHPELGSSNGDCDSVLREWSVNPANPDVIDYSAGANASRVVLRIRKPQANHNGGQLKFGPDGYLYIAVGDGGGGNDNGSGTNFNDPSDGHTSPGGNGQDITNVYGKILRIDPVNPSLTPGSSDPASSNNAYRVPAGNPFAGATAGLDEIFAYGLRNPFRFSFDRGGTHQLFAGDVGQAQREEVDIITNGQNYGWVNMEGTRVNTTSIPSVRPIAEYQHTDGGTAIIGGYVYRGSNFPEMSGKYVFGDLDPGTGHGRLFYSDSTQPGPTSWNTITEFTFAAGNSAPGRLYSFGEDKDGELYAMFDNGTVARLLGRQWMSQTSGSWNTTGNWLLATGGAVPNGLGAVANFLGRASSNVTVSLDGSKTVGQLRFNHPTNGYTIAAGSGGTLTIDNGTTSPHALVQVIRGNHTVTAPLTIGGLTDFDIASGTNLTVAGSFTVAAARKITKLGAGTMTLAGPVTFNPGMTASTSLTITAGNVVVAPAAPTPSFGEILITGGKLDLTDNAAVVTQSAVGSWTGSNYTALSGLIRSGRNGGNWSGNGIVTSQSAATASSLTSIAIATAAQVKDITGTQTALWAGETVIPSNALVMYTYGGDANLDGKINVDDYGRIDSGIALGTNGWYNGDFNYDGKINVDDYGVIDSNVGIQGAPFPAASLPLVGFAEQGASAIPEAVGTCILSLVPLALRRRRSATRIP